MGSVGEGLDCKEREELGLLPTGFTITPAGSSIPLPRDKHGQSDRPGSG